MTKDILRRCGEAYGSQRQLAFAIRADERTMRRWVSGETPIPAGLADEVAAVLQEHATTLRGEAAACEAAARDALREERGSSL
jgi:acetylornithine/succinyldiaminopimelate/putrescine aminotransferase